MATLSPLVDAPLAVQVHAGFALLAVAIGPFALFRKRRDRLHKTLGYLWVLAMVITAGSSFALRGMALIGPFGPIHLLSVWTFIALAMGVRFAVQRRVDAHRRTMQSLYFWALGIAGLFTLLPGRVMHRVFFADDTLLGFGLILAAAGVTGALTWRGMRGGEARLSN